MLPNALVPAVKDSILDTIGHTPLVRLSRIGAGLRPALIAKLEVVQPGRLDQGPDRRGADRGRRARGQLRPGGTIVEPTSGNTGTGLAIVARLKGYRVIAVMPDKMSQEKIDLLRAYGAEVVVAPTDVPPDSPQSYYRVADRLDGGDPRRVSAKPVPQPGQPAGPLRRRPDPSCGSRPLGGSPISSSASEPAARSPAPPATCASAGPTLSSSAPIPRARSTPAARTDVRPYLVEGVGEDFWPQTFEPSRRGPVGDRLRPGRVPRRRGGWLRSRGFSPADPADWRCTPRCRSPVSSVIPMRWSS